MGYFFKHRWGDSAVKKTVPDPHINISFGKKTIPQRIKNCHVGCMPPKHSDVLGPI